MSDQDLIVARSLRNDDDDDDNIDDMDRSDSDEEGEADLPPLTPLSQGEKQERGLISAWLQQCNKYADMSQGKFLKEITSVHVPNPKVYQFASGEKPGKIIQERFDGLKGKKLAAKWQDVRLAFIARAQVRDGTSFLGYVTRGKADALSQLPVNHPSRFLRLPQPLLGAIHPPDFKPGLHYKATQQDQRTVTLKTSDGKSYESVNFDPRLVLRHAKLAGAAASSRKTMTTKNAKKRMKAGFDLGAEVCAAANSLLLGIQGAPSLSSVSVVLAQSPHYKALQSLIGEDDFPVMRSEETDGLRMLPDNVGGDLGAAMETFLKLTFADSLKSRQWDSGTIMRALIILQMAPQFVTTPAVDLLRTMGMALSEKNIASVMREFETTDRSHAIVAQTFAHLIAAQLIFDEMANTKHPVLETAAPLIAFASAALRLGALREFRFSPEATPNPPVLRCALTGMAIPPGMPFYMVPARSRPTDALPTGQAMIAIVAKLVNNAFMCPAPAEPSAKQKSGAPKKSKAEKTPEELEEIKKKKNEAARERRLQKKLEKEAATEAKAAEDSSPSPPPTPVPSPRKKKRAAPPDEAAAARKKQQTTARTPPGEIYLGTFPAFGEHLILDAGHAFQTLAQFATIDPVVNQAMDIFLAKAPKRYDPSLAPQEAFAMWMKNNVSVFMQLVGVFQAFVKKRDTLNDEQRQCLEKKEEEEDSGGADVNEEEESDAMELDPEVLAAFEDLGIVAKKKKKETKPAQPRYLVKSAPVQTDVMFAPFVATLARLPSRPSKLVEALKAADIVSATLPQLLALVSETNTDEETSKKMLGNTLAAFKWLFPSA